MRGLEKIGAFTYANFNLAGGEMPERIPGAVVSPSVLQLLGVNPIQGRIFETEEAQNGRDDVVVISERLWQRRFNRDPHTVGSKVVMNGRSFTIVGIMPKGFDFPLQLFNLGSGGQFGERADIWQPLAFTDAQMKNRYSRGLAVIGRLKSGTTVAQAQSEIDGINVQMRHDHPDAYAQGDSFGGEIFPLQALAVSGMRPMLLILLVAAVRRAPDRVRKSHDHAARARRCARTRVCHPCRARCGAIPSPSSILCESVLLSVIGGAAGSLLAVWGLDLLRAIGVQTVPRIAEANLDARVLVVMLAVSIGTGIIFGIVPGFASGNPEVTEALKEGGRGSTEGRRRNRVRNALVIAEVAMALVLLVSAGLLMKSFARLQNVDPGFDPDNVLTMEVALPLAKYPRGKPVADLFAGATRRIKALPESKPPHSPRSCR